MGQIYGPGVVCLADDDGVEAHVPEAADLLVAGDAAGGGEAAGYRLPEGLEVLVGGAGEGPVGVDVGEDQVLRAQVLHF